ncbi:hypothetical protein NC653_008963 [Populus alba x Populus x berolinensis]|uniref:Uncharacterized protein n=1 Tax=Populus alba x Populus x berolinensis TaxID=444605 RepID=A0AAD6R7R9_9ROSI|nr:hypothetical protein NC653_008963 [Populus alba x Populus x berolinensis]
MESMVIKLPSQPASLDREQEER